MQISPPILLTNVLIASSAIPDPCALGVILKIVAAVLSLVGIVSLVRIIAAGDEAIETGESRGLSVVRSGVVLAAAGEKKLRIQPRKIYLFDLMTGQPERLGSGIIVNGDPSPEWG